MACVTGGDVKKAGADVWDGQSVIYTNLAKLMFDQLIEDIITRKTHLIMDWKEHQQVMYTWGQGLYSSPVIMYQSATMLTHMDDGHAQIFYKYEWLHTWSMYVDLNLMQTLMKKVLFRRLRKEREDCPVSSGQLQHLHHVHTPDKQGNTTTTYWWWKAQGLLSVPRSTSFVPVSDVFTGQRLTSIRSARRWGRGRRW